MKIAIVIHDLKGGGAEKMMARLANAFADIGDQVSLILLTSGGINKSILSDKVKLVELNSPRTVFSLFRLRRYLVKANPDKILAALTHVNVIAILTCILCGKLRKLFVSERNAFSRDKHVNGEILVKIAYAIAPFLYRFISNPVIAVSNGVADDLVNTTIVRKCDVTSAKNPVVDNGFETHEYSEASHRWLVDKEKPVLIAAGRLADQKGFDTLLHAFFLVRKEFDCRLIIFGEGDLRPDLEKIITEYELSNDVSLPGYVSNPLNEMKAADLFILSSRFEGSPNVLVEAMSTGIPVISTSCPYGPSEILDNGSIAPLINVDEVSELSEAIISVMRKDVVINRERQMAKVREYTSYNAALSYKEIFV